MALFDSKSALNHAIKYLSDVAIKRAAGGWVPPKVQERQQKEAVRQEQQQARQVEKQKRDAERKNNFTKYNANNLQDLLAEAKSKGITADVEDTGNEWYLHGIARNKEQSNAGEGVKFLEHLKLLADQNKMPIGLHVTPTEHHDILVDYYNKLGFDTTDYDSNGSRMIRMPSTSDITKSEGGAILSKQFPTQYMPNVGRQVMNTGGTPDQPQRQLSPMGFYSAAAERAQTLQPSGDAVQMVNALKNTQGIKTEELQNAGLIDQAGNVHPDWAGRGKVTREDLVSHLQGQMPQVEETMLGGKRGGTKQEILNYKNPKYSQYTLPGGENYREVLLKLPYQKNEDLEKLQQTLGDLVKKRTDATAEYKRIAEELSPEHPAADEARSKITEYNIPIATIKQGIDQIVEEERRKGFRSGHWDDTNVLAHIRMADRTGPNGEKILHVEELQSDWGQKGKKEGFDTPEMRSKLLKELPEGYVVKPSDYQRTGGVTRYSVFDPNGVEVGIGNGRENAINSTLNYLNDQIRGTSASLVPAAPYVTSTEGWTDLALKRVLKEAAEGGYDKVVWTPGAEQAKRYDLSKQIDGLQYVPKTNTLYAYQNGRVVINKTAKPEELEDVVGKDVAKKLLSSKLDDYGVGNLSHYIEGQDLSVGGEGMKGYYDNIVPKRLQNLAKKHDKNARLGYVNLSGIVAPNTELDELSGAINFDRPKKEKPKLQFNLPSLDITPAMRESILRGQSAYKRGGTVSKRHPALSIAGTHIREEEHGEPMFTGRL